MSDPSNLNDDRRRRLADLDFLIPTSASPSHEVIESIFAEVLPSSNTVPTR